MGWFYICFHRIGPSSVSLLHVRSNQLKDNGNGTTSTAGPFPTFMSLQKRLWCPLPAGKRMKTTCPTAGENMEQRATGWPLLTPLVCPDQTHSTVWDQVTPCGQTPLSQACHLACRAHLECDLETHEPLFPLVRMPHQEKPLVHGWVASTIYTWILLWCFNLHWSNLSFSFSELAWIMITLHLCSFAIGTPHVSSFMLPKSIIVDDMHV